MSDWTKDTADAIERGVATLRDRTVEPAYAASRAAVFGVLAGIVIFPALLILFVGLFRVIVVIEQGYVWAAWCTMGGIFLLAGWFCWTKRNP